MASIPEPVHSTAKMIYTAYENAADDGHRPHLGASLIGHHCERYLWLVFRWSKKQKFPGRMLRLFETGKMEEKRICQNLRMIDCEVHEDDGTGQYRVSALGGHFGGSMDAVIHGFHEAPTQWMPVEMKTHNAKSFKELVEKRLQAAKPMHYSQLTTYMGLSDMKKSGLYFAANKDTDEIYVERIHFDEAEFDRLMARAARVINANEPPLRISNDPSWYQCKMCHMAEICHGAEAPEPSCRSCAHSTPEINGENGRWSCSFVPSDSLDLYKQRNGCENHRYIPVLLERFAKVIDASEEYNWVRYENTLTGNSFYNGDLSSQEIFACQDKRALGDASVQSIRHELGGKIAA